LARRRDEEGLLLRGMGAAVVELFPSRSDLGSTSASSLSSSSSCLGTMDALARGEGKEGVAAKLLLGGAMERLLREEGEEAEVGSRAEGGGAEAMGVGEGERMEVAAEVVGVETTRCSRAADGLGRISWLWSRGLSATPSIGNSPESEDLLGGTGELGDAGRRRRDGPPPPARPRPEWDEGDEDSVSD